LVSTATVEDSADPHSKLDLHANMIVIGCHAFIFEQTGRTCNVQPFSSDLGIAKNVPVVDTAIAYDCTYTFKTYILIIRNALYIPTIETNLIPPFIMRAGGLKVNDTAKIHYKDPDKNDHCIIFGESDLRIPLQLNGIFSYFHSHLPSIQELQDCDKYFITPNLNEWNPHCQSFEKNEWSMLDYEGEISDESQRCNLFMEVDNPAEDDFNTSSLSISAIDDYIDSNISNAYSADSNIDYSHDSNTDTD
jgi:hypothetical protein